MVKTYRSNSLTIEEQERLYSVLGTFEDLALFKLALTTGIRRDDIVKVEIGNIDLSRRVLKFWESKKRRWHEVPLTEDTKMTLERYIDIRKKEKMLFDFCGRTAYNKLQRALVKAGITKQISFHDLRRTLVKTAKKRGISPKAVSQITGDTLAVIDRHYSNLDMDELREEVKKL